MVKISSSDEIRNILKQIRCFALDMDGTFYLGQQLLDGATDFLDKVAETGRDFVFLTNNSSKSREDYIRKLAGMGVNITLKQIITSGQATIEYIKREFPGKSVYLLGNKTLENEFKQSGIILNDTSPDIVVTGFDTTLDYEKMCKICDFVRSGFPYIATHPDYNCPTESGFIPDIGAIHAFIHASTNRWPDKVIGKPSREIIDCALEQSCHSAEETAMIGDRLYTDIAVANNVPGLSAFLVLTGETSLEDLNGSDIKPNLIIPVLKSLIPYMEEV